MPDTLDNLRYKRDIYDDLLRDMDRYQNEANSNNHFSKLWSYLQAGLDVSEVAATTISKNAGPGMEMYTASVFKLRDLYKNYNDHTSDELKTAIIGADLADLNAALRNDKIGGAVSLMFQMEINAGRGQYVDAFINAMDAADNIIPDGKSIKQLFPIAKLIKGAKELQERQEEIASTDQSIRDNFNIEREKIIKKKAEINHKLFILSGGKEGEPRAVPLSDDAFTRIQELLDEINLKSQRVEINLNLG